MSLPADPLLETALTLATEAGALLTRRFGDVRELGHKTTRSNLVTDVDRASEALIAAGLAERHPDHALLAEEGSAREGTGIRWIVDPLDGTVNYAHGIPHFCVSIAAVDEAGPRVGVIHDPLRGETFAAVRGAGAWLDGAPLHVAGTEVLADAIVATGFAYDRERRKENLVYFSDIAPDVRGVRRAGSAALDLAWVAAGRLGCFWELSLAPWDVAAGVLLVREAGGVVTAFPAEADPVFHGDLVAGPPPLHAELRARLGLRPVG